LGLKYINKMKLYIYIYILRLTQLYNILLLLFDYWLLVSASRGHHKANIYKKILKFWCIFIHSLVFSLRGRVGRDQSPVM